MTTFNWSITKMQNYPQYQGQTQVVFSVDWQCIANDVDINNNNISSSMNGSCNITYDPNTSFVPYNVLTQDEVLSWIWANGVIQDAVQGVLQNNIVSLQNSPQDLPLPWAT